MFSPSPRSDQPSIGLTTIHEKYAAFNQHIQTFLQALSNSKEARALNILYDPVVRTAGQVKIYHDASRHAVEKRTLKMFLDVHQELSRLRAVIERDMSQVDIQAPDMEFQEFVNLMTEWEAMNDVTYDFSDVRAKWPHREINHLSCVQARERFGGTVCILPVLIDYATKCSKLLTSLQQKFPPYDPNNLQRSGPFSLRNNQQIPEDFHPNSCNKNDVNSNGSQESPQKSPKKKIPTNSKKRLEKFMSCPDASLRLVNGKLCPTCKQPENPEKSGSGKKRGEEYNWQPARVWRGASKGAINHVAHRYCACKSHKETKAPDHSYHAPEIY